MSISAIDREFLDYFARLSELQKKSLVQMMKTFLKSSSKQKERISIEEYNRELDNAMKRIARGELTTLEDLEHEMASW